ncbi:F-box domain protein [Akanthomyces lecanii RCEF 1005]|uniref:F-box domain protein n=1 Tax=Akanthomyces lecanii RCEF 1005 TaxID=1081108 RepID=A0A168KQ12_CORDF|nr:F-box domain protein [Akanthomyces lecanii RCEF 1005]
MSANCHSDAHGPDRGGVQTRLGHLPEELLLRIVDFAYGPDVDLDHAYILADRHGVFHALALVDRRLNRLATPLLYKVFATSENPFRERQRIRKTELFLRALKENALLRAHVRGLCLYTAEGRDKYPSLDVFDRVKELVTLVPNTHFLHMNGGFDDFRSQTLDIVSTAIVNMRHLRHLSLNRQGYGPTLQDVAEAFRRSWGVKRLSLNGVTAMTGVTSPIIHEKEYRTASFTHLTLKDYSEDWAATEQLLSWPKELHSFQFGNFRNNPNDMDLAMFGSALLQHRNTLTVLDLGFLRRRNTDSQMIDLSQFSALRELTLSRWSFNNTNLTFSYETGRKLLAPKLRTFTWSFGIGFMESERLSDVGPNEEAWLRDFGTYAADRHDGSLRTMYVRYLPIRVLGEQGSAEYPWDRLRRVADELAARDIELLYSDPKWSRDEWEKCVKAWEEWT